jgi:metal-responsive CopG/Arc/MetJ family transcriptional regulator
MMLGSNIGSTTSSTTDDGMKISVSLSQELVQYIDDRVDNRSQLIESLLLTWQQNQQRELMVAACLALDEQQSTEEAEWQQAALTDWEVSG